VRDLRLKCPEPAGRVRAPDSAPGLKRGGGGGGAGNYSRHQGTRGYYYCRVHMEGK